MNERRLQRYRLLEEVGHGGMAVVYRGLDESLEREVAVKVLHPHLAARLEHRRRLAREARAVARLKHANILEIHDFAGEDSEDAFLVTELIRGRTLKAFAQAHPFDPPELGVACVHELAGALAHAHAHGIIHRDLKPENVMVREDGPAPVIKLMDFGIAQILDRDERMTVTGSLMGSPAHMAPEIIDGKDADERSDVFSLGTILYWLVTGHLPFEAPSPGALLRKILEGDYTDPRVLCPSVSDQLARLIGEAMHRDREQRLPSAATFQEKLAALLSEEGFQRPGDLLTDFLRAPRETPPKVRELVVAHLMSTGRSEAGQRRTARALAAYGRVIAIVPGTPEAGAARKAIDALKTRVRWRNRAAGGIATMLAAALVIVLSPFWKPFFERPPDEPAASEETAEATVPAERSFEATTPDALADVGDDPETPPSAEPEPPAPRRARTGTRVAAVESNPPPGPSEPLLPAQVFITVKPFAHVEIDGRPVGTTPFQGDVEPGLRRIRLTHDCCEPMEIEAELRSQRRTDLREKLSPRPAALSVDLDGPDDTGIMVDEEFRAFARELGERPLYIPLGVDASGEPRYERNVSLRFFRDGYRDRILPLKVRAGQPATVKVSMTEAG